MLMWCVSKEIKKVPEVKISKYVNEKFSYRASTEVDYPTLDSNL